MITVTEIVSACVTAVTPAVTGSATKGVHLVVSVTAVDVTLPLLQAVLPLPFSFFTITVTLDAVAATGTAL